MRRVRLNEQLARKDRVTASYEPEREGIITELGDEVSEVKWLDDGSYEFVINERLEKI